MEQFIKLSPEFDGDCELAQEIAHAVADLESVLDAKNNE